MKNIIKNKLRKLNTYAGFLHLTQAALVLLLSTDFKLPVLGTYLSFNSESMLLEPATTEIFQIELGYLVAGFFLLSAAAHFFIVSFYQKSYVRDLDKGINKARWYEYSVSASIMMVAIAMLVGIYDAGSLIMIFALTSTMNLMGLVMEIHNQTTKKTNWLSYNIGVFAGIFPWVVIGLYFWLSASNGSAPPTFVYWIYFSILLFFNCFAINMILQYKKIGKWKNYLYGERAYIILSLVAKSALAWQVFAGTLRP